MGEGECEQLPEEQPKKSRHRKKHLYNTILQQMEFYFSDSNLAKDRFLSQILSESSCVDLEVFLKFNKIRKLNCTVEDIKKAIKKSDIIGVSEDGLKVHRKVPVKVKENVDFCTIYVENIKADANHESLSQIFSDFGNVVYVSIPKYKHNKANKGFAFIEYENEQQANEAISFFESIGCKIPAQKNPEELQSILTFEGDQSNIEPDKPQNQEQEENKEVLEENIKKRKLSSEENNQDKESEAIKEVPEEHIRKRKLSTEENDENMKTIIKEVPEENLKKRKLSTEEDVNKKQKKLDINDQPETSTETKLKTDEGEQNPTNEKDEVKKKKKNKKAKRKQYIKELGLLVLSKKEWKKLRNTYLDLQRKKMKEFKQYLYKQKYGPKSYNKEASEEKYEHKESEEVIEEVNKLSYIPGVIVKLRLPEPCIDVKKLKNDIKSTSPEVQFVDVPLPAGSEEVFIRFSTKDSASEFCNNEFSGEKTVLSGDEESSYWEKIMNDRAVKFQKTAKKQRGRDKLLKKAEKESAKHLRFEENE